MTADDHGNLLGIDPKTKWEIINLGALEDIFKMADWTGLVVLLLAIIVLVLYRLFTDKDARFFPREDRETWKIYERTNFVVFVLALASIYFLVRFIKWAWIARNGKF